MLTPIVIAGPTASGKSAYAMRLAKDIKGEIICADSRQVYSRMRVGTAGPTAKEEKEVPHHGFHTIDPKEKFDAGRFIEQTDAFVNEIRSRGKTPILVGGTGLYLRAWRYGLGDVPSKDEQIRKQLNERLQNEGLASLYAELKQIDEDSAATIYAQDAFRILRALEIFYATKKKPSELRKSHFYRQPRIDAKWLLVWPESREWLRARIEKRARVMFEQSLVVEARELKNYLGAEHPLVKTMGYEEALLLDEGRISYEEAIEKTALRQNQYAKRQLTWFKKEPWWSFLCASN